MGILMLKKKDAIKMSCLPECVDMSEQLCLNWINKFAAYIFARKFHKLMVEVDVEILKHDNIIQFRYQDKPFCEARIMKGQNMGDFINRRTTIIASVKHDITIPIGHRSKLYP
jgi:hypothetical protein